MAKSKAAAPVSVVKTVSKPKAKEKPEVNESPVMMIPIGYPDPGFCPNTVSSRLSRRQRMALKSLFCQLRRDHATCQMEGRDRGKIVEEYTHVVRWLLDQVADGWEESTGEKLEECEGVE